MEYPSHMILEVSSICNLKCVMCLHSATNFRRPKVFVSEEILNKLEKCLKQIKCLQLFGIGEPLMSPVFWKVLKIISPECDVSVNSNFFEVSDADIENLVDSPLKRISVSIDSPDVETYYKIRGADLNAIIDNVRRLTKLVSEKKSGLVVLLNMTLMRENILQINAALDLCKETGCVGLETWPLNNWHSPTLNRQMRGWDFNYEEQLPWNFVELYTEKLKRALEYSEIINTKFYCNFI